MLRVSATRAASICVLVIHARSSVCKPNSPKLIRKLREAVPLRLPRWGFRYFGGLGMNGINIRLRLAQLVLVVVARLRSALRLVLLPSYTSSISHRSFHKPCSLPQTRNRSRCAMCAAALCPRDTTPNAKFRHHSIDPSNANEFLPRQNPSPSGPLSSSRGDSGSAVGLLRHGLGHQLRIHLPSLDLLDVDLYLFALPHLRNFFR